MSLILPPWYGHGATPGLWGAAAGGDPYFSSVVLLALNDNAADATTTFVDQSNAARTLTTVGQAQYDTAQAPTGMTSSGLFGGTDDAVTAASSADFGYSTSDFTIEFMIRFTSVTGTRVFYDQRTAAPSVTPVFYSSGTSLRYHVNGADRITANSAVAIDTWYHTAVARSGTSTKLFLNGTQVGSTYSDSNTYITSPVFCGYSFQAAADFAGWLGCIRVTKGVARYTTNFTPPTLPLPTS